MNNKIAAYLNQNKNNLTIDDSQIKFLNDNGYLIVNKTQQYWDNFNINLTNIKNICDELLNKEGSKAGKEGKFINKSKVAEEGAYRLSNLLGKNNEFQKFLTLPDLLHPVSSVIGYNFQLSSFDMREPKINNGYQGLHLDIPQREKLNQKFNQCTAFVLLDDMKVENGGLRVVPRSHIEMQHIKSGSLYEHKRNKDDHIIIEDADKKSITITAKMGSIIFLNVNTFHAGTMNTSGERRRVLFINFRDRNLRSQIEHYDFIPKHNHTNFNELEKYLLKLHKKNILEKLKRKVHIYRKNIFVSLLLKIYAKFKK